MRRGFVLLTAGQVLFLISGYATHITLARGLGPAEYGTYGVLLSILSTVALVLTAGMPEAIAKFAAERPSDAGAIFAQGIGIQFRFSLLLGLVYAALSPLIARALHDPGLTLDLAASALAIPPVALYSVAIGALNGERRFAAQALTIGGYGALRCALVIGLTQRFQVVGAVAGFVIAPFVVVSCVLPGIWRRRAASVLESRTLWLFARPVIGFTVALALLMNLDLFVVKSVVLDPDVVGYYTAAATIAKVPYFFFSALGVVLLPIVSSAGGEDHGRVLGVVRNAVRLTFVAALGVASVAVPLSRVTLRTLYGQRYVVAALPLGLLVVASTLFTLTFIVAYALNGLGKPGLALRLTAAGLMLEALLAFLLTPRFGAAGAAASSCVASLAILVALVHYAKPELGSVFALKSLLRTSVAFIATVAVGALFPYDSPVYLLLSVPLALGHVALLVVLRELSIPEILSWVRRERGSMSELRGQ
ncbi:MAG TPA: oligosaccharide flippase family protein [Polyangiaceae bacterium]|nr:oligosaccharide flippase family protein [Polyangiaceae bacterium]